jgi:para-nitrobenzyl esterase
MKADPEVAIVSGRLRGRARGDVAEFLGVPYGADTRTTRFRAPKPAPAWGGVRDALAYGAACPQANALPDVQSEDCLVLNGWTPTLEKRAKKPVLVYIHGGAFSNGSSSGALLDGANLAMQGDAVVLTLNHRLNLFGHLYLGHLAPGGEHASSGNAGLLDLVLALKWVRDNITAFGGDPECVTLFGQSGGGAKIATLMAMPAAQGLFHRAWTMSGQQVTAQGPRGASNRAIAAIEAMGARVGDLDALSTDQLLKGLTAKDPTMRGRAYWGPVLDDVSLPVHPFWPEAPAQSAKLPMVMGNTREETGSLIGGADRALLSLTWDQLPARLERDMVTDIQVGHVIEVYRKLYPEITPTLLFFRATTAGRSWRGQVIEAETRARQGAPTWVYQLNWPAVVDDGKRGAFHTLDIPLLLRNTAASDDSGDGPEARALSAIMSDALMRFARTGNPNGGALGAWPKYDLAKRGTMIFDKVSKAENDPRKAERELFGVSPYIQPGTY